MVVAFVLSVTFLWYIAISMDSTRSLENMALLDGTTVIRGEVNGKLVHCHNSKDAAVCLDNLNREKTILWLGNSQLHSINQISPGDQPASALLHERARGTDNYVLTFSQANANLQEHLLLLSYLNAKVAVDTLILPVFFDDLRETGVRTSIMDFFKGQEISAESTDFFKSLINAPKASAQFDEINDDNVRQASPIVDLDILEGTPQKIVEGYLGSGLSRFSTVWKEQGEIRGRLLVNLYKLRNFFLGITASSVRKSIPSRYEKNMQALSEILTLTNKNQIRTFVYIPPLRDDYNRPYDLAEYNNFKAEVKALTVAKMANFADLESLVPNRLWGMKGSTGFNADSDVELDFMHFQMGGHELLADKIFSLISDESELRERL